MRKVGKRRHIIVLAVIFTVGFGCKFLKPGEPVETIKETPEVKKETTEVTKEALRRRLGEKGVTTASAAPTNEPQKPNPLTLQVRFATGNDTFLLNSEVYASFGALADTLRQIFTERERNGVFIEGTNEVYKKITLPAYQTFIDDYNAKRIFVEDFEQLVDDLRREGFDQIELDSDERNLPPAPVVILRRDREEPSNEPAINEKADSTSTKSVDIKTVSGGVINGKAVNLPKPAYPPAARAVGASGAVNVKVTVNENGDVVSAEAVSGHPLLRASATAAARGAKFNPTMLSGKPVKVTGIIVYNFTPD